jgi:hypothetical protein
MAKVGTKVYCPACKSFNICQAVSPTKAGKPKAQRWYRTDHEDISWFRRARRCSQCGTVFLTAEIDETFLTEIVTLRSQLAAKNMVIAARLRRARPWLVRQEDAPIELAREFVRATAWWHTHSSGLPVRAPRHANRIYKNHHGWVVDFGANSFLVGKAISRCAREIDSYIENGTRGELVRLDELRTKLVMHIRGAVANHNQDEYDGYYSLTGTNMMFGAQSIDVHDGADFMLSTSGIKKLVTA